MVHVLESMQRRSFSLSVCATVIGGLVACSPTRDGGPAVVLESGDAAGSAASSGILDAGQKDRDTAGQDAAGRDTAGRVAAVPSPDGGGEGENGNTVSAPSDGVEATPLDAGAPGDDAGADASTVPAPIDPELERLSALAARLAPLAERTATFWLEHGPDAVSGGFYATLDQQGSPIAPEDKGLIQQARHLWMLSTWYERRAPTPTLAELAAQQFSFLRQSFVDATDGAFVYKVSRDGGRVVDGRKQLFAESYAIYALSTYGRVFQVSDATALALARFESIDASRHDAVNGGYDQRGDPGELPAGAAKDTNTHLHLMEAFTALYEATADAGVAARLDELVELFATRLRQPSGYVHAAFTLDWALVGAPRVSYGHDLETAWLLLEAARVVGRSADPAVTGAALAIAAHAAARGFDTALGGYFEAGVPDAAPDDLDKVWWVQFEAIEGLWWANALSGDALYLDRLERSLGWIESTEDRPSGEWFAATNADGSAAGASYKGDEWKASYHSVRALVYLQDWIDAERALRTTR